MFKCNDCGREFENPKVEKEIIGTDNQTGIIQYYYCPFCDSSNIDYLEEIMNKLFEEASLDDE